MSDRRIETVVVDGVATVRLTRADKKNAMSLSMWRELAAVMGMLEAEAAVRAIILTGGDSCFSAGADISEFKDVRSTPSQVAAYEAEVDGALAAISGMSKPTISAVSGACFGGGVALAASTDFRVADASALFSVSAVHMGLVYNVAKCTRLYRLIGLTNAKLMLMTGARYDVAAAQRLGFVDIVADSAAAGAGDLAAQLCRGAPLAVAGLKAILDALGEDDIAARREKLERLIEQADASEDHREAARAFAEKRLPVFQGR